MRGAAGDVPILLQRWQGNPSLPTPASACRERKWQKSAGCPGVFTWSVFGVEGWDLCAVTAPRCVPSLAAEGDPLSPVPGGSVRGGQDPAGQPHRGGSQQGGGAGLVLLPPNTTELRTLSLSPRKSCGSSWIRNASTCPSRTGLSSARGWWTLGSLSWSSWASKCW